MTSVSTVLASCQGDYLAMGVWDASLGSYGVVGMGDWSVVSKVLYSDHFGDNNGTTQNWSNGLNWYRTSGAGSWGFTTAGETALNTADVNLNNGFGNAYGGGTDERTLAAGLSFHVNNGNLISGWAYNPTGSNFTFIEGADQRVFWVANSNTAAISEPGSIALLGIGALALIRRRNRR
ncbi:PEP-CTERM sorting domain-containing protein [Telluria beijingensis]|uniref:PEP-CTERM sorting domain-containing protein n=1 Tax=Telluria beijingensis TaxID=3068633 RepID=UPI0027959829|nr:PEP-CTERM sorting domain-containing protein [Massilia sp. REN29]